VAAIFALWHTWTQDSIPSSLSVLPEPGNKGVAVGISLRSCIQAEIYVISYLFPANGRHLWFLTYADIGQHSQLFIPVVWPRKHECSRMNFVAIMFTSWDIRNFLSTSGQWPPSLLYDIPRHRTASLYLLPVYGTENELFYYLWNCVAVMYIGCRHLKFLTSGFIWECYWQHHWKVWPRKHGSNRWNFVPS